MSRTLALDVTRLVRRALRGRVPTGIDRVGLAYVEHLHDRAQAVNRVGQTVMVASPSASKRLFDALLSSSRVGITRAVATLTPDRTSRARRVLVHTGHSGLEHPSLVEGWRGVLTFVHDLIPITHPELARPGEADKHRLRIRSALRRSAAIVVNSDETRKELAAFAASEKIALPPITVAHLGISTPAVPRSARPIEVPYFVVVGTIEARKNHWLLLQLWRRLVDAKGSAAPKLVILGQRGWEVEHVIDLLERCEVLRDHVIEKSGVSDRDLAAYVQHAQALLFPSLVEGYGLPLVEALAAGVPVVASDLPVFREIVGNLPFYVDPLDGPGWLAQIDKLTARTVRVHDFRGPTWRDHFAIVDPVITGLE